ncbi:lymphocyte transmembrane adapter 1 isoform X1 [Ochotona princeps]|uniref:lymphocyte transmembrane adapter 1 isoform X1 n=2 Tax=Ochotona princeps TaxID=9978 RepID=UPI002714FA62|nr:lymphocyte transmembrane adapter 1 isoform X1 [Ochotona princeps]
MGTHTTILSESIGRTLAAHTRQVAPKSQEGDRDQSGGIILVFAGLLALLLVVTVACILWTWNKRKQRQVPYLRVTGMPSLTLPRPRQRAKNIYDLLPPRQEDLGRPQVSSIRIFNTESLLSRNLEPPGPAPSQVSSTHQGHEVHVPALGYAVGIYDNAPMSQVCSNRAPSVHYINVQAPGRHVSTSSEDSNDYVNVPTTDAVAESPALVTSSLGSLFINPSTQRLEFPEERQQGCECASDYSTLWYPGTASSNDALSDGEDSSQASDDYVNMTGLDPGARQEQPWGVLQCCREHGNVTPVEPDGSQQQAGGEVTSPSPDHTADRTVGPETHSQSLPQRLLAAGDLVAFQLPVQSDNSQLKQEETSSEESDDYENVLVVHLGGGHVEQWPAELRASYPIGRSHDRICPASFAATEEPQEDPGPP